MAKWETGVYVQWLIDRSGRRVALQKAKGENGWKLCQNGYANEGYVSGGLPSDELGPDLRRGRYRAEIYTYNGSHVLGFSLDTWEEVKKK